MTTVVTPANGPWNATLSVPADGEAISSASVITYVQEIANRLEYLRQRTPGANPVANLLELFLEVESANLVGASDWTVSATNAGGFPQNPILIQQAIAQSAPVKITLPLDKFLRTGMIIRAMSLDWCGKSGHAGNVFTTRPTVQLYKFARSLGASYATAINAVIGTVIDTAVDAAANTAAYEVVHTISKTIAPETVDLTNFTYVMSINGEYGGNAVLGSFGLRPTISVSA